MATKEIQAARRAAGVCSSCDAPVFAAGKCFRCYLVRAFARRGIGYYRRRQLKAWNVFVHGMAVRYERILQEEGFAVDAIRAPEDLIDVSGMTWAKGRLRKKVLEIIAQMDDRAIRKRFS